MKLILHEAAKSGQIAIQLQEEASCSRSPSFNHLLRRPSRAAQVLFQSAVAAGRVSQANQISIRVICIAHRAAIESIDRRRLLRRCLRLLDCVLLDHAALVSRATHREPSFMLLKSQQIQATE